MKNLKCRMVAMFVVLTMILTLAAGSAAQEPSWVEVELDPGISVLLDGNEQIFRNAQGYVVLPMTFEWSTFLPVRALANLFEVPIDWDAESRTVILGEGELQPPPEPRDGTPHEGRVNALVDPSISIRFDGEYQVLTNVHGDIIHPILLDGTTYLPVRALAGLFDVEIDWDGATRTVILGEVPQEPPPELPPDVEPDWFEVPWGLGHPGETTGEILDTDFPERLQERMSGFHLFYAIRLPDAVSGEISSVRFRTDTEVTGISFDWYIGATTADLDMGSRYRVSVINADDNTVIWHFDWDLNYVTWDEEWLEFVNFEQLRPLDMISDVIITFQHLGGATLSDIWIFGFWWQGE